ncbi:MAG: hypothetical protein KGH81_07150 [Thaumarchaeota archaeon]|nr:hypothetical protein [Nitrososphaerota archaeon]
MLCLVAGLTIGLSINASAQEAAIPSWVKNTALWWGQGQISDAEFIKSIQWLIDQKMLSVPQSSSSPSSQEQPQLSTGISSTDCHKDEAIPGIVHMTGKYTNGPTAYSFVNLQLGLIDTNGNVVAVGAATIPDVGAYQTKIFDATAVYSGQFAKCEIQVSYDMP